MLFKPSPVGTVVEFLQEHFSSGLAYAALEVYVATISASPIPLECSVGRHPLLSWFLCSAK